MRHPLVLSSVAVVAISSVFACTAPVPYGSDSDNLMGTTDEKKRKTSSKPRAADEAEAEAEEETTLAAATSDAVAAAAAPACTNECAENARRCLATGRSGTEVCAAAADGCRRWTQGRDCDVGFTCDPTRNDGTCKAGCTNDIGCSAARLGDERCSSNGTAEEVCSQAGGCFVFRTTRSNVPQQCSATGSSCSQGRRVTCTASTTGVCLQHVLTSTPCSSGATCQGAGMCVASCANDAGCSASTVGALKCTSGSATGRLRCTKVDACYKFTAYSSCASSEVCGSGGTCSCVGVCTRGARRCSSSSNARQDCVMASTGCTVWTSTSCASSHVCFDGVCGPP